jgi:hypothetical protein
MTMAMSQTQQYLANALNCAQRGETAAEPGERQDLQRAEQAWLVLAGIESATPPRPPPAAAPLPTTPAARADRQGYRPGWYVG